MRQNAANYDTPASQRQAQIGEVVAVGLSNFAFDLGVIGRHTACNRLRDGLWASTNR